MTEQRAEKFQRVAANRQQGLTVILENVHDPHNIGAVMRTADSVGLTHIYVLYTEDQLTENHITLGRRASAGTRRWVEVRLFRDVDACFAAVRKEVDTVLATHLGESAVDLYDIDFTQHIALVFGNEKDGVSPQTLAHCDGNFLIDQKGMVESLNISVACAVSLYEALRQRRQANYYGAANPAGVSFAERCYTTYVNQHQAGDTGHMIFPWQE